MRGHPFTDAPHLLDLGVTQYPITLERIADIDHTAGVAQQALGSVISQLRQRLGAGDTHAHGNAGAPQYLGPNIAA